MSLRTAIVKSGNVTLTMRENKNNYAITVLGLLIPVELSIPKSKVMEEWNLAICPVIYKSVRRRAFTIQNYLTFDIDQQVWYRTTRKWQQFDLDSGIFESVIKRVMIPDMYKHEIKEALNIDDISKATLEQVLDRWEHIPDSIDVSKWRTMHTIDTIIKEEIWKHLPAVIAEGVVGRMSINSFRITMRTFYSRNIEYVNSDFRRFMVKRKVVLPIHAPTTLKNNFYVMTSTPQTNDAGAVAELPEGIKLSKKGYAKRKPKYSISSTTAQCPFPQRMPANREVVLKAISQAMWLNEPDETLVDSEFVEQGGQIG